MRMLGLGVLTSLGLTVAATAAEPPFVPTADPYFLAGQQTLAQRKSQKPNTRSAKNVILFVADGMDPTTVAAARIYDGQTRGEPGEENLLSFERFPYLAMVKTYTTSGQTPDSAGTMSAMTTGVKTKSGAISVTDASPIGDCGASLNARALTIAELAEMKGLATGVVSTARITHATPAAVYSHVPDRDWESNGNLPEAAKSGGCTDIARQLIEFPYGDGVDVALGGGRSNFLTAEIVDPEYPSRKGARTDGRDLTAEWTSKSTSHAFIWNKQAFDALDASKAPRVLGLFEPSHMRYEADRADDPAGEPSLAEMTKKAIEILSRNKKGFVLVVEGGRVDHAHHEGNAARALIDTQAFAEAVAVAHAMTSERDTLIIATADHGHTMAFQGYPAKGTDILGLATATFEDAGDAHGHALAGDKKPYTTLVYANGPGSVFVAGKKTSERPAPTADEARHLNYKQQALIPMSYETHGGQDVTIYASGPQAHLFGGVVEQNYIFHVIDAALSLRSKR